VSLLQLVDPQNGVGERPLKEGYPTHQSGGGLFDLVEKFDALRGRRNARLLVYAQSVAQPNGECATITVGRKLTGSNPAPHGPLGHAESHSHLTRAEFVVSRCRH